MTRPSVPVIQPGTDPAVIHGLPALVVRRGVASMTAEQAWAAYRDQGGVTARRAFMAGRESVLADRDPSIFEDDPAAFQTMTTALRAITTNNVAPAPVAHALVKASSWVWGLAVLLSVTAGLVGIVTKSVPWCAAALVGAFVAVFATVARMSDGDDREALKAAAVTAGAFLYVAMLTGTAVAVVIAGWGK